MVAEKSTERALILDVAQGSKAWHAARLGIPTASNFNRIVTGAGYFSAASARYMDDLMEEWRSRERRQFEATFWMQRGLEMEPQARAAYAVQTGHAVAEVGLVYLNAQRLVAASPDGMVGDDGLLEIKCPMPAIHAAHVRGAKLPGPYIPQVQGQLWVSQRKWCDFFSYHPDSAEQLLLRVYRDEPYIEKLRCAVGLFVHKMLEQRRADSAAGIPPA